MTRVRRPGLRALTVAAATIGAVAMGAPAQAAPVVATPLCESGASRFICSTSYSGASGSVTIRWTLNGLPAPGGDNRTFFSGTCSPNSSVIVRVTVTDSTGSTTQGSSFRCSNGPWP